MEIALKRSRPSLNLKAAGTRIINNLQGLRNSWRNRSIQILETPDLSELVKAKCYAILLKWLIDRMELEGHRVSSREVDTLEEHLKQRFGEIFQDFPKLSEDEQEIIIQTRRITHKYVRMWCIQALDKIIWWSSVRRKISVV